VRTIGGRLLRGGGPGEGVDRDHVRTPVRSNTCTTVDPGTATRKHRIEQVFGDGVHLA
jgi:hypothetical protein